MANIGTKRGVIGILTGGATFPVLTQPSAASLCALCAKATSHRHSPRLGRPCGYGPREGLRQFDNFFLLDEETVDRAGRTGGTFLHLPAQSRPRCQVQRSRI